MSTSPEHQINVIDIQQANVSIHVYLLNCHGYYYCCRSRPKPRESLWNKNDVKIFLSQSILAQQPSFGVKDGTYQPIKQTVVVSLYRLVSCGNLPTLVEFINENRIKYVLAGFPGVVAAHTKFVYIAIIFTYKTTSTCNTYAR